MNKEINIAAIQMEVVPGHPDINFKNIVKEIDLAKKRKIDLAIFSEMAVPGYLLGDEWENDRFIDDLMYFNQRIKEKSEDIAVAWGNVFADPDKKNEDGRIRKYNAVHLAQNGEWINNKVFDGHTFKTLMPKYREFDDERHFYSMLKLANEENKNLNDLLKPFPVKIGSGEIMVGAMLCEDMWHDDYAFNPSRILVENGAEILANLSCSPWTWRKNDKRHRVIKSILEKNPVPFIYVNNVGTQNNGKNLFLFDGGTTIYNSDATIAATTKNYTPESLDLKINGVKKQTVEISPLSDELDTKELYDGLIYGIKNFYKNKNKKALIGLSGGIDSAVSASLLVDALGAENVIAVNMPSEFNSDITKNAAQKLANNLDIQNYMVIPIQDSIELTKKQLEENGIQVDAAIFGSIQARDRGSRVLPALAAGLNALFVNNGNKTETALGYATLYGDVNGAIAPIGDLYKWEIYKMANYINIIHNKEIIPSEIINVVPSAELDKDQDVTQGKGDPIFYPYHDKLIRSFIEFRRDPEDILLMYKDNTLEETLKIENGLIDKQFANSQDFIKDLEEKWTLYKTNYFKRIHGTTIITVSRRAFGFDLRESLNGVYFTQNYLKIKNELMGKN